MKKWISGLVGLGFLFGASALAQTYSTEEVVVSGIDFSRFAAELKTDENFDQFAASRRWERNIERNFCWSGVFTLRSSYYPYCQANRAPEMQIQLNGLGDKVEFAVADLQGNILLRVQLPIQDDQIREEDIMQGVNELIERLTGIRGILGTPIAFTLKQPDRKKIIALTNTHGTQMQSLTQNEDISLFPRWSPSQDQLLFTSVGRRGTTLWLHDLRNQTATPLKKGEDGVTSGGTWYQDGQRVIATISINGNVDLYEIELQSGNTRRLTKHPRIDTAPTLSPDNRNLIFVSDRTGREQIFMRDMEKGAIYRLTFDGFSNSDPVWSPDGTRIAFSRGIKGYNHIFMMDPFGDEVQQLTFGNYNAEKPAWSPDGRQIVFAADRAGSYKLYVMFVDGTGVRRLTDTPRNFEETGASWGTKWPGTP
jgi:TolB protein